MWRDPRNYQILFLTLFLGLGIITRDWTLQWQGIAVAIATCLLTQLLLTSLVPRIRAWCSLAADGAEVAAPPVEPSLSVPETDRWNWRSPLITALGISLLLRVDHLPTLVLACGVAIASKFCLTVNGKHFFNPANSGIIASLALTQDAWVSPGQWGEDIWYLFIFLGAGGLVLKRVGRWDTTVAFLGGYACLEGLRNLWLGWTWDVWAHRMMSGSLLLFALFMVTDPRSIPNARPARLLWASSIALLTFVLRNYAYLPTAVFWALFLLSPLTPLLDQLWAAPRFEWQRRSPAGSASWLGTRSAMGAAVDLAIGRLGEQPRSPLT